MSKELIERLRGFKDTPRTADNLCHEAADRIEELERQLLAEKERCDSYMEDNKRLAGERDALQADNARLREVLDEAATSLETIQLRSYGDESYLNHMDQVRGFAGARSRVAKEALATTPEQSLARIRNQVREEAAKVADTTEEVPEGWTISGAIRATKEKE